ncbi:MAG: TonB family protein [Deltaproteobacteria bacterium]|nr:MAG: TonB family protein [Deltaproteobacteria bacterium]
MLSQGKRLAIAVAVAVSSGGVAIGVVRSVYSPVRPTLMCVKVVSDRTAVAYLGWDNVEDEPLAFPVGEENRFSPGAADRGQPRSFLPGKGGEFPRGALEVSFEGPSLTWHLGSRELVVTRDSAPCPQPTSFEELPTAALVLPKITPPPEPPKPPEPPPEPIKPVVKETEKVTDKPDEKKAPTRKPKNHIKKAGQPKPKNETKRESPKDAPKNEPAPLVLTGLTKLGKGVAIQSGEQDILGDASVEANERNTNVEQVDDPDKVPDEVGDGTGGTRAPKRTPPKVKKRVRGVYPEDAPRLGRSVSVALSLLVGTDGTVKRVKIVRGAGGAFDREAEKVGRQLLFSPGLVDGTPTEQWVPWVVEFAPDDW